MLMQVIGIVAVSAYLALTGEWHAAIAAGWRPWASAVFAGVLNAVSSLSLYYAFEIGSMSVAAPVSSAFPALTVTLALLSGEHIDATRGAGLLLTFAGVILAAISFAPDREAQNDGGAGSGNAGLVRGAGWAIVSAIGFGLMFWWLGFHVVREIGGAASVLAVRVVTFLSLLIAAVPARQNIRAPGGKIWWLLLGIGVTDTIAFVANNSGMRIGHVSIVTVLSSLYGAVTVLLGGIFVRERIAKSQWCGIALIFAGIVLVNL